MADPTTSSRLRRVLYSAVEVHEAHPGWSNAAIEDYLDLNNNEETLAEEIDSNIDNIRSSTIRSYFYGRVY